MREYSRTQFSDDAMVARLDSSASTVRVDLAGIAEVDSRKLYVPMGYPSMYHYCMGRLLMSEPTAYKRIRVAPRKPVSHEPQMTAAAAEVVPWLRGLGFRIAEAHAAASLCENMASEPLEKRVRVALSYFKTGSGARVAHAVT